MSHRIYVATRKGLFIVERSGGGWEVTDAFFEGDNCPLVMIDPRDRAIYAGLNHGHFGSKMHRSDDGGSTWTEIAAPHYPDPPEGYDPPISPMGGKPVPWSLKLIWALEPGGTEAGDGLWCGTIPGGLFSSHDRGESWTLNRPLWDDPARHQWFGGGYDFPGIHSVCVHPDNARHIAVGVSCGGVWLTDDGGQSWRLGGRGLRAEYMPPEQAGDLGIQDPHMLVRCSASPQHMWTQHHNGIFRSEDGGETWREMEDVQPASFGFAVAVHPTNPDIAWFIPGVKDEKRIPVNGELVVTRTADGGKSFQSLRSGLPQQHAYDIVYRHALDIDAVGEKLAFGSTTGSMWISEDQGENWSTISHHLPPVHAVRFAPAR